MIVSVVLSWLGARDAGVGAVADRFIRSLCLSSLFFKSLSIPLNGVTPIPLPSTML